MCEVFSELGYALVLFFSSTIYRGIAQLVGRGIWDAEVGGSNPSTPTKRERLCSGSPDYRGVCGLDSQKYMIGLVSGKVLETWLSERM